MGLLAVDEAIRRITSGVEPLPAESVPLEEAAGRTLAGPLVATRTQPPFHASAMDGYAVRHADVARLPARLRRVGEAAAGHAHTGAIGPAECVRIFTGAPLPTGADAVVIQENAREEDGWVSVVDGSPDPAHVRPAGGDFAAGQALLSEGLVLAPRHLMLAAAMGHGALPVRRRPLVAILSTGDELVVPGAPARADQIVASNGYGIAALVAATGGEPRLLGIARDTREALAEKIEEAAEADILVTIGGASVGDHDLVAPSLQDAGFSLGFWKIAMRPGKPLMFATRADQRAIGVPGNPVSALICGRVFVVPLIASLLGRSGGGWAGETTARLAEPLPANGPRQHYMRAETWLEAGELRVRPGLNQDSSLMSLLARANALIVRAAGAPSLQAGEKVTVLPIDF